MNNITLHIVQDGNIEQCRELCNELMAFQKSKAILAPEAFDGMNFDTRMKKSYENALASQVVIAKDGETPIGYIFSTVEKVANVKGPFPAWAPSVPGQTLQGFYPDWPDLPEKIGCLSNLYFRDAYRGTGLGSKLTEMSTTWFKSLPDIDLVFTYISNGNDNALKFYLAHGYTYSHEVFGGFIKAAYMRIKR